MFLSFVDTKSNTISIASLSCNLALSILKFESDTYLFVIYEFLLCIS